MAGIFVNVDGTKYISTKYLVDAMVKLSVGGTQVEDLEVYEGERACVTVFQDLLANIPSLEMRKEFHDKYVSERFIKRTLGS